MAISYQSKSFLSKYTQSTYSKTGMTVNTDSLICRLAEGSFQVKFMNGP